MRKKILLAMFLATFCFQAEAVVVVHREGWGLFRKWYKYVAEEDYDNGDIYVTCSEPGFTKCQPQMNTAFPTNPSNPMTETKYETLITYAEGCITQTNNSGTFIFDNSYYVHYNYSELIDVFTIKIYTIQEAIDLHLIN